MLSDDCLYSVQPEPRSLTYALRREKGIKDIGLYLRGNSRTAIADFSLAWIAAPQSARRTRLAFLQRARGALGVGYSGPAHEPHAELATSR
jgi:hypothetical protein